MKRILWMGFFLLACKTVGPSEVKTGSSEPKMKLFGHRGLSAELPENTMRSVREALSIADGAEIDVMLTKDQTVIVLHDETLERTAFEVAPSEQKLLKKEVAQLNYDDIKKIRVGPLDPLPTLSDILELLREHPGKELLIELKSYGSGDEQAKQAMIEALRRLFAGPYADVLAQVRFISFDEDVLRGLLADSYFKNLARVYWILKASDMDDPLKWGEILQKSKPFHGLDLESHPSLFRADAGGQTFIDRIKSDGKEVITWVNRRQQTDGLMYQKLNEALGVNIFTTDLPREVRYPKLYEKRFQEAMDFLAKQSLTPQILKSPVLFKSQREGKVTRNIFYSPREASFLTFPNRDDALVRDLEGLKQIADRIYIHIGDLSLKDQSPLVTYLTSDPSHFQKFIVLGPKETNVEEVATIEQMRERVAKASRQVFRYNQRGQCIAP